MGERAAPRRARAHADEDARARRALGPATDLLADLSSGARDRGELEQRLRRHDGSLIWCRTVMTLVRDASGLPAHLIGMLEDISDRKRDEEELVHRALHDGLTGLPNRQLFLDRLRLAIERRERPGASGTAVIFLDLDGCKRVNDNMGHDAVDRLLIAVAKRLNEGLRPAVPPRVSGATSSS